MDIKQKKIKQNVTKLFEFKLNGINLIDIRQKEITKQKIKKD